MEPADIIVSCPGHPDGWAPPHPESFEGTIRWTCSADGTPVSGGREQVQCRSGHRWVAVETLISIDGRWERTGGTGWRQIA